jgi:hypothetical protein
MSFLPPEYAVSLSTSVDKTINKTLPCDKCATPEGGRVSTLYYHYS